MPDDLALTIPALRRAQTQNAAHLGRMAPALAAKAVDFARRMLLHGRPIGFVQSRRTAAEQLAIWRHGRVQRADLVWDLVDKRLVQTYAQTVADTAHGCLCGTDDDKHPGCAFAFDFAFLVDGALVGPRPGPGNDSWDREMPWRDAAMILGRIGLVSGASFGESSKGALDGWDAGHAELPRWRELRAAHVASRGAP